MGLPRSKLVKPKSSDVGPVASSAFSDRVPTAVAAPVSPFEAAATMQAVPSPFQFEPFAPGSTAPLPFGAFVNVVAPPAAVGEGTMREALTTSADVVEVEVSPDSRQVSDSRQVAPPSARSPYPSAISASELLERAAAMGPARMTWESIVLPADPILDEKRQPHVAERRERFTRMVKIGLGACLAVCVVALGVSALSGDGSSSSSSSSATASSSEAVARTIPAKAIVPIEPFDGTRHGKAVRRLAPTVATAVVRPKRR